MFLPFKWETPSFELCTICRPAINDLNSAKAKPLIKSAAVQ